MDSVKQNCKKCESDFILDSDDLGFYKKMKVPNPVVCPDCRFKMRAMWRNEMSLYSGRKCDLCGKSILSMYNPKLQYTVYCYDCYYSEKWDARDYAMEYDKNRPFFDQMKELLLKVPKINLGISSTEGANINSTYANMVGSLKNCYLVFNTSPSEDLMYSRGVKNGLDSSDIYFGIDFERCYECVNIKDSNGVFWGQNVSGCVDSYFILNGSGLINCFGCVNLRNKGNCWFNEQLTPEEYSRKLIEFKGSFKKAEEYKNKFIEFCKALPRKENNNLNSVNSTGDYLNECRNVRDSFEVAKGENSKYIFSSKMTKDSIGTIGYGTNSELLLEVVATGFSSNIIGSYWAANSSNSMYCFEIRNCKECIGCDTIKNGQYFILNKEYSKEAYEELKEHIVEELTSKGIHGLIMPSEIAPFAYNETIAQDNMPLTKEEALAQGFRWEDDIQMTTGKETLKTEDIPDHIKDVSSSITAEILKCMDCERNYKIVEQELVFYRKLSLPLPRKCFFCRHKDRLNKRGSLKFFVRKCSNCSKETYTNLAEYTAPIMYCEKCYQQEVY